MTLGRVKNGSLVLCSAALFCAAVWAAWGGVYPWLRWAMLFGSAVAGATAPRRAIQFAVFCAPLLPIVSRALLQYDNLSLAEHVVIGLLPAVLLRAGGAADMRPRSSINRGLLLFTGVVVASYLRVLFQYGAAGVGPIDFAAAPLRWYFAPTLGHFAWDRFVVLRHTLVFVEAALWWAALQAPGTGLRSADLRRSLVAGALVCSAVGVVQSWWQFAPTRSLGNVELQLFRITATLQDNNTLGDYVVLTLPLVCIAAWWSWKAQQGWFQTSVLTAGSGMLGYTLLATASRSSVVGLGTSVALVAAVVVWQPHLFGVVVSRRVGRRILALGVGGLVFVGAVVATITGLDLGRELDYGRAANLRQLVLLTLNLRRPANEILAGRVLYWERAVALWRLHPMLGIGIGRFALWKENPLDGIVVAGPGGTGRGIRVPASQEFNRWVNAIGSLNFEKADVLAGDTIESPGGGWGPITISGRWSATQLILERPAPPTNHGDFVIRHPPVDTRFAPHAHRSLNRLMPFWTTAHNFYLQVLSELGLVGLSAFLYLIWTVFAEAWRGMLRGGRTARHWVAAATTGILALLVASLAQDPLTVREIQYVFWAVAALLVVRVRQSPQASSPSP